MQFGGGGTNDPLTSYILVINTSDDGFAVSSDGVVGLVFCLYLPYVLQCLFNCNSLLLIDDI